MFSRPICAITRSILCRSPRSRMRPDLRSSNNNPETSSHPVPVKVRAQVPKSRRCHLPPQGADIRVSATYSTSIQPGSSVESLKDSRTRLHAPRASDLYKRLHLLANRLTAHNTCGQESHQARLTAAVPPQCQQPPVLTVTSRILSRSLSCTDSHVSQVSSGILISWLNSSSPEIS